MSQFLNMVLGNVEPSIFVAYVFFALLGAVLSLLINGMHRNPVSQKSPVRFSWAFFLCDNAKRIVTSLLLIYVALRFSNQLFGINLNEWWAIAIGLTNDRIAQGLKNITNNFGTKPAV